MPNAVDLAAPGLGLSAIDAEYDIMDAALDSAKAPGKFDHLEELLNFGHSAHDDTVDSMVLTMGGLLRRGKLEIDYNSNSFDL